jgi:citrate synthase
VKKIKSIKQLKAEKKRLKQRQAELEEEIRNKWNGLKENLKPMNIVKGTLNGIMKSRTEDNLYGEGFVRNAITYGVTVLANKLLNKAGSMLGKGLKKVPVIEN